MFTVRFVSHLLHPATIRVLASREESEVVRVEASGVSALVINGHSSRNASLENKVHDNMNSDGGCFTEHFNSGVMPKTGSGFGVSSPFPAIRFPVYLALFCDAFKQWFWWSSGYHKQKSLRPDRLTDGRGFRRSRNAGKEVELWNGRKLAMSI